MAARSISLPCHRWKIICSRRASEWNRTRYWGNCIASAPRQFKAMAKLLFWVSAGFALYVYIGYPIVLWILQTFFRSSPRKQPVEPSISLLVAAYNEAGVIGEKIRNSLALDYPADKLEVVVASDGSRDATAEIVRGFSEGEN